MTIIVDTCVEIDLEEIDTDDLIEELESRGEDFMPEGLEDFIEGLLGCKIFAATNEEIANCVLKELGRI